MSQLLSVIRSDLS